MAKLKYQQQISPINFGFPADYGINPAPSFDQASFLDATPKASEEAAPVNPPNEQQLLQALYAQKVAESQLSPNLPGTVREQEVDTGMEQKSSTAEKLKKLYSLQELLDRQKLLDQSDPFYQDNKNLLASQKAGLLARLQEPVQVDFSPIASTVDAWTGSNMAKDARPVQDTIPQEFENYQGNITAAQKSQKDALQSLISGEQNKQLLLALTQKDKEKQIDLSAHQGAGKEDTNFFKYLKLVEDNTKPFRDARQTAADLMRALQTPNWLTDGNVKGMIVELRRLKPVSDRDMNNAAGSPDFMSQVSRAIDKLSTGRQFTADDTLILRKWAATIYEVSQQRVTDIIQQHNKYIAPGVHGLDKKSAKTATKAYLEDTNIKPVEADKAAYDILNKYRAKKAK